MTLLLEQSQAAELDLISALIAPERRVLENLHAREDAIYGMLKPEDFVNGQCGALFDVLGKLHATLDSRGGFVLSDFLDGLAFHPLHAASKNDWLIFLNERMNAWANPATLRYLSHKVYRAARLRERAAAFVEEREALGEVNLSNIGPDGKLMGLPERGDAALSLDGIEPPDLNVTFDEKVEQFRVDVLSETRPAPFILGVHAIDRSMELRGGHFFVIGATRSSGKSTLCGQAALNIAQSGHGVLLLPLEMSTDEMIERMTCNLAGATIYEMRNGGKSRSLVEKINSTMDRLKALPLYIEEPKPDLGTIRNLISRHVRSKNVRVVVVDHIQCIDDDAGEHGSRNLEVAAISKALKAMAREHGIAVICASQINRAGVDEPQLHHLRDSGAIENDADQVVLVWKRENGEVVFRIAKNRHGATSVDWAPLDIDFPLFRVNAGNAPQSEAIYT
jgi:archaellum biogenesis ATPase FlaH